MTDDNPLTSSRAATYAPLSPAILAEMDERVRQNEQWGEQNHPDGTGPDETPLEEHYLELPIGLHVHNATAAQLRDVAREITTARALAGEVTWTHILLEEVLEAIAESDPRRLHAELIQVAAVSTQWADAIQRRGGLQ